MDINLTQQGAAQNYTAPLPGKDAVSAPSTATKTITKAAVPQVKAADIDLDATDEQRKQRVTHAAQLFKDAYVVSDTTFAIFKDSKGQYITRFTNLRDGSVTYIPEMDIMEFMENTRRAQEALVKIEV